MDKKNKSNRKIFIVLKSTIPPGTTKELQTKIFNKDIYKNIHLGSNPEFLREGNAVYDFMNSERIVIGSESAEFIRTLKKIYAPLTNKSKILSTDTQSSELIKYGSNAFLANLIAKFLLYETVFFFREYLNLILLFNLSILFLFFIFKLPSTIINIDVFLFLPIFFIKFNKSILIL